MYLFPFWEANLDQTAHRSSRVNIASFGPAQSPTLDTAVSAPTTWVASGYKPGPPSPRCSASSSWSCPAEGVISPSVLGRVRKFVREDCVGVRWVGVDWDVTSVGLLAGGGGPTSTAPA